MANVSINNITETWSSSGTTYTGIKYNVTDNGSATGSKLIDLQVGGVSKFSIDKTGLFNSAIRTNTQPVYVNATYNTGMFSSADGYFLYLGNRYNGALVTIGDNNISAPTFRGALQTGGTYNALGISQSASLPNNSTISGVTDVYFWGGVPADNGNNRWAARIFFKLGSGASSTISNTDGGYGGAFDIRLGAGGNGNGTGVKGADGYFAIRNASDTLLFNVNYSGLVQFGGTTSQFPALKQSSNTLQSRLADDSAFANIQGKIQTHSNAVAETPTATHTITLYDATGTAYKVLAVPA